MSIQAASSLSCNQFDFWILWVAENSLCTVVTRWNHAQCIIIQLFNWGTNVNNLKINCMLVIRQSSNLRYSLAGVLKPDVKLMEGSWPWQRGAQRGLVQLAGCKRQCYIHTLYMILSIRLHLVQQTTWVGLHTGPVRKIQPIMPFLQLPSLALCSCANLSLASEHFDFGHGAV